MINEFKKVTMALIMCFLMVLVLGATTAGATLSGDGAATGAQQASESEGIDKDGASDAQQASESEGTDKEGASDTQQASGSEGTDEEVVIDVQQIFEAKGTDKEIEGEFTYELEAVSATHLDNAPLPKGAEKGKYTFTIKGNNTQSLVIHYGVAGEYEYTLKQVKDDPERRGYTYDDEVYTLRVYMANKGGKLVPQRVTIQQSVKGKDKIAQAVFTCGYEPKKCVLDTDPPVKKTITGETPAEQSEFEFILRAEKKDNPMPKIANDGVATVRVKGAGEAEFGVWEYTAAGTYVYTVSEKNTGVAGYKYDDNVYTITDNVTDEDGQLVLNREVRDKSNQLVTGIISFEFVNEYTPNTTPGGNGDGGNGDGKDGGKDDDGIFGPKTGDFFKNKPLMITVFGGIAVAIAATAWIVAVKRKNREEE